MSCANISDTWGLPEFNFISLCYEKKKKKWLLSLLLFLWLFFFDFHVGWLFSRARMMTEHTLMSFKSKNSILTEKEETEQKSTELEIVTELNLLLDHLTNENVDCVDKFMKVVGKYSTSVIGVGSKHEKRRAESVRYTSMCLQSIFSFLLRNSKSLSALVHERLKKVFDSFAKVCLWVANLYSNVYSFGIAWNSISILELLTTQSFRLVEVEKGRSFFFKRPIDFYDILAFDFQLF